MSTEEEIREKEENIDPKQAAKEDAKSILKFAIWLILFVAAFKLVFIQARIMSGSMEPTLMTGDRALFNRLAYTFGEPERGDIILFKSEEFGQNFTKRIIGLPGDVITFSDGEVYVNSECLPEDYLEDGVYSVSDKTFEVPEGCYFLLGDNRGNSNDSRFWTDPYIPKNKIYGRYLITIWHKR
jgi:signal peptidase I